MSDINTQSYLRHLNQKIRDNRRQAETTHTSQGQGGAVVTWTTSKGGAK